MKNKIISVIASVLLFAQTVAQADAGSLSDINASSGIYLDILASYGPLEYVSSGIVTIMDSNGSIIVRGKTNTAGSFSAHLSPDNYSRLPLKVSVSGGRLIGELGDDRGKFNGHLRATIVSLPNQPITVVYLDLLSTVASNLASSSLSYDDAVNKVKNVLGIYADAPSSFLRYLNGAVGISNLREKISKHKGFDSFVKYVSNRAGAGVKVSGLVPSSEEILKIQALLQAKISGKSVLKKSGAGASLPKVASPSDNTQSSSLCVIPLPDNKGTSGGSTSIISDFGVLVAEDLLDYAGAPSSVSALAGMLMTGGGSGSEPSDAVMEKVSAQLACIMAQINAVSGQIDSLATQVTVLQAQSCKKAVTSNFDTYNARVAAHKDTPETLNVDEELIEALPMWGPTEKGTIYQACAHGSEINEMLFGNGLGGATGAWSLLNTEYQNKYRWYTQAQVQKLQGFLDYWSEILYEEFVLTNEWYNYYGRYDTALRVSGGDPGSVGKCAVGTQWDDVSYCAVASNIKNAYPGHLYSDEIGMWDNGISVNPYPAGLSIGLSQVGLETVYILLHLDHEDQYFAKESYENAYNDFNHKAALNQALLTEYLNSQKNATTPKPPSNTAIETFDDAKAARTIKLVESDAKVLQLDQQPNGLRSADFFVNAINSSSKSEWKHLTGARGSTAFWTYDDYARETSCDGDGCVVSLGALVNNDNPDAQCIPFGHTRAACYDKYRPPVMGVLLGRDWWKGASNASSYVPPTPCASDNPQGCTPNR